jgi:hypothetical protein
MTVFELQKLYINERDQKIFMNGDYVVQIFCTGDACNSKASYGVT